MPPLSHQKSLLFFGGTNPQSTLVTNSSFIPSYIQSHSHQANSLSDPRWSKFPTLSVGVHGIYFPSFSSNVIISFSTSMIFSPQSCPIHSIQEASHATCVYDFMNDTWCNERHWLGMSDHPSWYQACCKFGLLAHPPPHHNFQLPNLSYPHRDQVRRALW